MTLLEEIQAEAVDENSKLGTLLRKCKMWAARVGSQPLEDWLIWESNGYPDDAPVPEYRVWPLELKGDFYGLFGMSYTNAPVSILQIPEKAQPHYRAYKCHQSIASIEEILVKNKSGIVALPTGDLRFMLTNVYEDMNCGRVWAEFSTSHLIELVNSVRNRVLDLALAVWKQQPDAGELDHRGGEAAERVTQIFNTTVYGGSANVVGTADRSIIAANVVVNDFASLAKLLASHGIEEGDTRDLKTAIETDSRPESPGRFGARVSAWIARMMGKAADGSWQVSLSAAGNLLSDAISRYYGLFG